MLAEDWASTLKVVGLIFIAIRHIFSLPDICIELRLTAQTSEQLAPNFMQTYLETFCFSLPKGKYAYIESSYRQKGDKAELVSRSMSGTKCMHFVYNMRGIYMGRMNVVQNYGQVRKVLLSLSGNHDRPWHKATVDIPNVAQPYKVRNI